jgi:hypothetical protein
MPAALQRSGLVREQLAFALNRMKRPDESLRLLQQVIDEQGASSETYGLIGRIHKDLWVEASKSGNAWSASGHLDRAIGAYVRGFETDWRDAYPGINAVTLLDIKGDPPSVTRKNELLPVVQFAVTQRLRSAKPDYWDYATLLELAVLASAPETVYRALGDAITAVREPWEPQTTANNLALIRSARSKRGINDPWLDEAVSALESAGAAAKR